jgi:hypothetical protein
MKTFLKYAIFAFALGCVGTTQAGETREVSFTNSATASGNGTYVNLALNKFNTGLGTLTAVNVTINFVSLGGNFTVVNIDEDFSIQLTQASAGVVIQEVLGSGLGYSAATSDAVVSTTPGLPYEIDPSGSKLFVVAPQTTLVASSQDIASNFWAPYQSAEGSGTVTFQVKNSPSFDIAGLGEAAFSPKKFTSTANMTVTYTYWTTAPEPGQVAASLLLLGGIGGYMVLRRRRLKTPA